MSVTQMIAEIEALPSAERVKIAEETLRRLGAEELKIVERTLRRLAHPDVPEEIWAGYEDYEDGRMVDLDVVLNEDPPAR